MSVTIAFPGAIATDISKNSGVGLSVEESAKSGDAPKFKMTAPADAAQIIVDAMEKDAFRVMVGADATMLDRLARLAPKKAAETHPEADEGPVARLIARTGIVPADAPAGVREV